MINKHKSNKIKENSNTVRHLNNGTDHRHSKSCCDQSSPARRTTKARGIKDGDKKYQLTTMTQTKLLSLLNELMISGLGVKLSQHISFSVILLIGIFRSFMIIHRDKCHRILLINLMSPHCFRLWLGAIMQEAFT